MTITLTAAASSPAVEALIENLTYANGADAPTASRTLTLNVTDAAGGSFAGAGIESVEELTGTDNPLNGIYVGSYSNPSFVDLDGDGDLDLVVGLSDGSLYTYLNGEDGTSGAYTEAIDTDNPFDGIDVGSRSAPSFVDLDGDGDLDLVVGASDGTLETYFNGGDGTSGAYIEPDNMDNPFDGIDVGSYSAPSFVDLDGDGDLDLVVGEQDGTLKTYINGGDGTSGAYIEAEDTDNPFDGIEVDVGLFRGQGNSVPSFVDLDGDGDLDLVSGEGDGTIKAYASSPPSGSGIGITVAITPENDGPVVTDLPSSVTVMEDTPSDLDLSALTLTDVDTDGDITVVLTASAGTMEAASSGGVAVADSGSDTLTLVGTASAIDSYLNESSAVTYTGVENVFGDAAATLTLTGDDGSGEVTFGTVDIDITDVNDAPVLTDFAPSVTFTENTVNTTPQLLDADVTFVDLEGNFDGGSVTLTGVLAEDTISVRNQGTGAGEIGLNGASVTYEGVEIGTLAGGAGADLTITLTAAASSLAVEALIENLTYANSADAPTASRTLTLNVTDAAGGSFQGAGIESVEELTGTDNPFDGIDVGNNSVPSFADLDGDGDLDLVVGEQDGTLKTYLNGDETSSGAYTEAADTDNPFDGIFFGVPFVSTPSFADLDGDGDLDLVVGDYDGGLKTYLNGDEISSGVYTVATGADDPFNGIDVGLYSAPSFIDLDGDGDLDLVVGNYGGIPKTYINGDDGSSGEYTEATGAANPFDGIDVGNNSLPSFADLDGDGDLDLVVGNNDGTLKTYINGDETSAGAYTEATGAADPFDGIDVGFASAPSFADLDGDGDLDLVVGAYDGTIKAFESSPPIGLGITVAITPENDAPVVTDLPSSVTVMEDTPSDLDLSALTLTDVDTDGDITVVLTASAGTLTAASGTGVAVAGKDSNTLSLTGTAASINAYLAVGSAIQYTAPENVFGNAAATLTLTGNDGSAEATLGTLDLDVTAVNDAPTLSVALEDQTSIEGNLASFVIPETAFVDIDTAELTLTATLSDGSSLPDWLTFDAPTRALTGTPPEDYSGSFEVEVTASDGEFSVSDTFELDIKEIQTSERAGGTLSGGSEADVLIGNFGTDVLNGLGGDDLIQDHGGDDIVNAGTGADWIRMLSGNNAVAGEEDNDLIIGGFDSDDLDGGAGDDIIIGDVSSNIGAADTITGGRGNDLLEGGLGGDTFIFATNDGNDTIGKLNVDTSGATASASIAGADFVSGIDVIVLSGFGLNDGADALELVSDVDGVAVFSDQGTSITFSNLTTADLSADDFNIL